MPLDDTVETTTIEESGTETTEIESELSIEDEIEAIANGTEETEATPEEVTEEPVVEAQEENVNEEVSEQEPTEEETFTPDFTYKAYGEIKQMPEWAQGLVNKENHGEMKSLFEKAGGFDHLKDYSKSLESNYKTLNESYSALNQDASEVVQAIESKDLGKAFEKLQINEQDLFAYVSKRLDYYEMPQEQRQQIDALNEAEKRNAMLEQQFTQQQEQTYAIQQQQHNFQVDMAMNAPEVSQVANQYDVAQGREGAFKELVNIEGAMEERATGKILSAQEAVQRAAQRLIGMPLTQVAQPQAQAPVSQENVIKMERPSAPPVIDGAVNTGVVKKTVSSLEELEKLANTL